MRILSGIISLMTASIFQFHRKLAWIFKLVDSLIITWSLLISLLPAGLKGHCPLVFSSERRCFRGRHFPTDPIPRALGQRLGGQRVGAHCRREVVRRRGSWRQSVDYFCQFSSSYIIITNLFPESVGPSLVKSTYVCSAVAPRSLEH